MQALIKKSVKENTSKASSQIDKLIDEKKELLKKKKMSKEDIVRI